MRKPISKHALRRALDRVHREGHFQYNEPIGTLVDRLWHEIEKASYRKPRKKSTSRETVRTATVEAEVTEEMATTPTEA